MIFSNIKEAMDEIVLMRKDMRLLQELLAQREKEIEEQARLLGISGSREAKLFSEIEEFKKKAEKLVEAIDKVIFECFRESEAGAVESLEEALAQYREAVKK